MISSLVITCLDCGMSHCSCHWSSIKDVRTRGKGGGGWQMRSADACVNFDCKRPNFADVGGGG